MISSNVRQRALMLDDHEAMLDLWHRSGLSSIRPQGRDSLAAFARQIASGVQQTIGLEDDGRLVAIIVATHDGRKGWLNRLAVDHAYRGRGLARHVIKAAEGWLATRDILVWAVLIEDDNETSIQLFESAGYVPAPHILYLSKRPSADS